MGMRVIERPTLAAVSLAALAALAGRAAAQGPPPAGGYDHRGLFVRAAGGLDLLLASNTDDWTEIEGWGGLGFLAAGGTVWSSAQMNLFLYGELYGAGVSGLKVDDQALDPPGGSASLLGGGVGAGYYVFDGHSGLHVGLSLGAARFAAHDASDDLLAGDRFGFAAHLVAGREWWVSPQIGVGLIVGVPFVITGDGAGASGSWISGGPWFGLSVTYN
jgi:hypothetical protein